MEYFSPWAVQHINAVTQDLLGSGLLDRSYGPTGGYQETPHFVQGESKKGVLWTLHAELRIECHGNATKRLHFIEVEFHSEAQHALNEALGGVIVHGGASAAIIDSMAAGCGWEALNRDPSVATASQQFQYRRPLFLGQRYLLQVWVPAKVGSLSQDTAAGIPSFEVEVRSVYIDQAGTELVTASSTIKRPRKRRHRL